MYSSNYNHVALNWSPFSNRAILKLNFGFNFAYIRVRLRTESCKISLLHMDIPCFVTMPCVCSYFLFLCSRTSKSIVTKARSTHKNHMRAAVVELNSPLTAKSLTFHKIMHAEKSTEKMIIPW